MASLSLSYQCSRHLVSPEPVLLHHPTPPSSRNSTFGVSFFGNAVACFILQASGDGDERQPNNIAYVSLTMGASRNPLSPLKETSVAASCYDVKQKPAGTVSPARAIPPGHLCRYSWRPWSSPQSRHHTVCVDDKLESRFAENAVAMLVIVMTILYWSE